MTERQFPRVMISVLNWNQFDMTMECLRSLEQTEYPNYRVVVVDNGSRAFPEAELARAFPGVERVRSDSNLGYAGGHRLAVELALRDDVDLIWLLNNDAFVKRDTLGELVTAYLRSGEGIYGSVQLLNDSTGRLAPWTLLELDSSGHPDYARNLQLSGRSFVDVFPLHDDTQAVAKVSGSSMLIPLSVIRRHGFIEESFFLYSEEADYCLRLRQAGIPSRLVLKSIIFHNHLSSSKDSAALSTMLRYYQTRNAHVVARRYRRHRDFANFFVSEFQRLTLILVSSLRNDPRGFARSTAYYHWRGFIDAYLGRMGKRFAPEDYLQ